MKPKKTGTMSRKTRQKLRASLVSLMHTIPYDKITIQEIVDQAWLTRTAFYNHYDSKDEIISDWLDELLAGMPSPRFCDHPDQKKEKLISS